MFHCDVLSHASSPTSLRPQHAKIKGDHEEYAIDFISNVKINNWSTRKGPYLHFFFTHFVYFDIPKWVLIEQVDECEHLSIFLSSEK